MTKSHHRIIIATTVIVLVAIAGTFAISSALMGASATGRTGLQSNTASARVTLIPAGTTQALPYKQGIPVCYDIPFNMSMSGSLSGSLRATGIINWYILSPSGRAPITGTIISGTITQALLSGQYVLEFCNQQRSSLNLSVTESFVVVQG